MNEAMTPEEKAAVMQFMGQTYGHFHKHDQNIVGNSGNLKPKSQEMKQVFEQTARMPTTCLLYTSPSPRDRQKTRMPSSA